MNIAGYTYITHKLINRPWGPECRYTVRKSDGSLIDDVVEISSMNISQAALIDVVSARLAKMKAAEDHEALVCHHFDHASQEIKDALRWLVVKIRQFPTATLAQAETAWNTEFADSLFTFSKLVAYFQRYVGDVTWAQFKTYVINHYFEGVD